MQNYLREHVQQDGKKSGKSINYINLVALIFGAFIKIVNVYCVELGTQIIVFLTVALQGPC